MQKTYKSEKKKNWSNAFLYKTLEIGISSITIITEWILRLNANLFWHITHYLIKIKKILPRG